MPFHRSVDSVSTRDVVGGTHPRESTECMRMERMRSRLFTAAHASTSATSARPSRLSFLLTIFRPPAASARSAETLKLVTLKRVSGRCVLGASSRVRGAPIVRERTHLRASLRLHLTLACLGERPSAILQCQTFGSIVRLCLVHVRNSRTDERCGPDAVSSPTCTGFNYSKSLLGALTLSPLRVSGQHRLTQLASWGRQYVVEHLIKCEAATRADAILSRLARFCPWCLIKMFKSSRNTSRTRTLT